MLYILAWLLNQREKFVQMIRRKIETKFSVCKTGKYGNYDSRSLKSVS